jgi:hypothetical protein
MKFILCAWPRISWALLFFTALILSGKTAAAESNRSADNTKSVSQEISIPPGTILPVRVGSLSSQKAKKGDVIKSRIMQDVPLANGAKLRAGTTVLGRVMDVSAAKSGQEATLTMKFDAVRRGKESIPISTHLRAIASTLEVESAQVPPIGPSESDVYDWLTTVQIGGEVVYGKGGAVYNRDRVVGRSLYDGVLAQVNAKAGSKCRGPVDGNDRPQAFWVFSSDACGAYGFPYMTIRHAGRTDPRGEIVLVSEQGPLKIRSGSGMLLRVDPSPTSASSSRERDRGPLPTRESNQTEQAPVCRLPQ